MDLSTIFRLYVDVGEVFIISYSPLLDCTANKNLEPKDRRRLASPKLIEESKKFSRSRAELPDYHPDGHIQLSCGESRTSASSR